MFMNESDRNKIWLKMDRRRRMVEPKSFRTMVTALQRAIQPFRDALSGYSFIADAAELAPSKIKRSEIEAGYLRLYQDVMPLFANRSYDDAMKGLKADATLREVWQDRVRDYVTVTLEPRITQVTLTIEKRVRELVLQGVKEGMSVSELAQNIDTLGLEEIITNRSRVIARTETINASNKGSLMGAEATGLSLKKEWIASLDGRERIAHAEAAERYQRDPIDLKADFIVDGEALQYPGDPSGSAGNIIQCRCTQAFVT